MTSSPTLDPVLVSSVFASPVGELQVVASDAGLVAVLWPADAGRARARVPLGAVTPGSHPVVDAALGELEAYVAGALRTFTVPLDLRGTPFQVTVWEALRTIPYGATISYGALADRLGRPGAARAVGAAVGRNPVSIVLPCHRVVGSGTAGPTGFAGGLDAKRWLLTHEATLAR
jgi:methylated-DNA-[protein]-cysteine S-methyltransferase